MSSSICFSKDKNTFAFSNSFLLKLGVCLSCTDNTMVTEDLPAQGANASATIILNESSQYVLVSGKEAVKHSIDDL